MWRKEGGIEIPEKIGKATSYKRKFSLVELYLSLVWVPRAARRLIKNKKKKLISDEFIERIHLAVTEVNGCAACSYMHTKMALEMGMSNEEITSFLTGNDAYVVPEEAKAISFSQHYADARSYPDKVAYEALVEEYGEEKSKIIIGAIQVMYARNLYGIPFSAFMARLKGDKFEDSSLFYEIGMQLAGIVLIPVAVIHALLRRLVNPKEVFYARS